MELKLSDCVHHLVEVILPKAGPAHEPIGVFGVAVAMEVAEDVQVIGVPDPKYGEEVCAWVKLHPGEEMTAGELRAFCQGQIAHFKIPRYVKFVDAFPMTVTGKVQKFKMREISTKELGL